MKHPLSVLFVISGERRRRTVKVDRRMAKTGGGVRVNLEDSTKRPAAGSRQPEVRSLRSRGPLFFPLRRYFLGGSASGFRWSLAAAICRDSVSHHLFHHCVARGECSGRDGGTESGHPRDVSFGGGEFFVARRSGSLLPRLGCSFYAHGFAFLPN